MAKVVLITGGSRGIGAACAVIAAREGWSVGVNYAASAEAAGTVVAEIRQQGGQAVALHGDVSNEADVQAMFTACEDALGPVNGLVNNAGILDRSCAFTDISLERWTRLHAVNAAGSFLVAREAVGRMLAHEIKNPLAGINGAAQLLRDDVKTDEGQKLIDLIRSEIGRIRRLADRMETLGDRNPENLSLVNIHEILRDARKLMQATVPENIVFTEDYDPSLPETLGDRDTLMQALLNLIKNASEALEASGNGGEITLQTSFRSGVVRKGFSGRPDQGLPIEIRITDNGPGIPPRIREQIFQPFVTDKPSGQGLGLALVAKVAAAHDGLIELKSRPGRTVFSLLLPALSAAEMPDGVPDEI